VLISLGTGPRPEGDVVDLFLDCHERIRRFVELARVLGRRGDLPAAEVEDGCARVARYFRQALPLHVADEEHSVLPRLGGHSARIDDALSRMHRQHEDHEAPLAALLAACDALGRASADRAARARLLAAAERLAAELEPHLQLEETVLFPAVRELLAPAVQTEIRSELRARRA